MLSVEKCYEILNKEGKNYTREQAKEIGEILNLFAEIIIEHRPVNDEKESSKQKGNSV